MYTFLLMAHSGWRYLVLLAVIVVIVKYLSGWIRGQAWSPLDRMLGLVATVLIDLQLLIGLVLWPIANNTYPMPRQRAIEHPLIMVVAIAVMHIGMGRLRRSESGQYRLATLTFAATTILILVGLTLVGGIV